jgi:hypothetical protein
MQVDLLASLRRLSDTELVARVKDLAARERGAMVLLVAHLAELDTRDVHLRAGHGSLFAYCREVLALSEQEAYNRIAVARTARRFPVVLEMLEVGAVSLTTVKLLGPRLTSENHLSALESARGKSKLQVEEIAARLWSRPDVPSFVRKLPAPRLAAPLPEAQGPAGGARTPGAPFVPGQDGPLRPGVPQVGTVSGSSLAPSQSGCPPMPVPYPQPTTNTSGTAPMTAPEPPMPPAIRWFPRGSGADVTPLSPDRYRVQVTIGGDTLEKLRLAKDLLRHAVPTGDEAAILDRALTALLASLAQKKFAAAENPRPPGGTAPGSRHIPAEVKRAVWLRDLGRCAFIATSGRRCAERGFLEFHHVRPYAAGGEATVRNIQLRCRNHNDYEARVFFGQARTNGGGRAVQEQAAPLGSGPVPHDGSRTRSGTSSGPGPLIDSGPSLPSGNRSP